MNLTQLTEVQVGRKLSQSWTASYIFNRGLESFGYVIVKHLYHFSLKLWHVKILLSNWSIPAWNLQHFWKETSAIQFPNINDPEFFPVLSNKCIYEVQIGWFGTHFQLKWGLVWCKKKVLNSLREWILIWNTWLSIDSIDTNSHTDFSQQNWTKLHTNDVYIFKVNLPVFLMKTDHMNWP